MVHYTSMFSIKYFPSLNETKHFWFYLITILFLYKNKYDIFSSSAIKQIFFLPTKTSLQKGEKRLGIYSEN